MLENNYSNLHQSEFYQKVSSECTDHDGYERETKSVFFKSTAIQAAIFACDEHLKRLDKPPVLKKAIN